MQRSIALRKGEVVLRADFCPTGQPQPDQPGAQGALQAEGRIVRLGYGVYAKARPSVLSGKPIPRVTLKNWRRKPCANWARPPNWAGRNKAYAQGRSTQIPAHTTFNTGQRRISRKITVGISTVRYETITNQEHDWILAARSEGLTSLPPACLKRPAGHPGVAHHRRRRQRRHSTGVLWRRLAKAHGLINACPKTSISS